MSLATQRWRDDDLRWDEARGLFDEQDDPAAQVKVSDKEEKQFAQQFAQRYITELEHLFVRVQQMFHEHMPQASDVVYRIRTFKQDLRVRLIPQTEFQREREAVSSRIPSKRTPVEEPDIAEALLEAPAKLAFVRRLITRLPQTLFHRKNRTLATKVEMLSAQCSELVTIKTYVGEVREVQACIASFKAHDSARERLADEVKQLRGRGETWSKIQEIEKRYNELFAALATLKRQVEAVHVEYPDLFSPDIVQLERSINEDYKTLFLPMRAAARPSLFASLGKRIMEILAQITFQDLLTSDTPQIDFLYSIASSYETAKHKEIYPEEYQVAYHLISLARLYNRIRRAIQEHNFLSISAHEVGLLNELSGEELAPLRELLQAEALPYITSRSPQMQRRLIAHIKGVIAIGPELSSEALVIGLDRIDKKLTPKPPKVYHVTHEIELYKSLDAETCELLLGSIAKHIEENTLDQMTRNEITRFRDAYNPNYRYFEALIAQTLENNFRTYLRGGITIDTLAKYTSHIQEFIRGNSVLEGSRLIQEKLRHILDHSYLVTKYIEKHPFRFEWVLEPCPKCIKQKLDNDEWDELCYSEINQFRSKYATSYPLFAAKLQTLLDTRTTSELIKWKEDYFDPFLQEHNEPMRHTYARKLTEVECVQHFLSEVEYRLNPPSVWALLAVLFCDLLRYLRG